MKHFFSLEIFLGINIDLAFIKWDAQISDLATAFLKAFILMFTTLEALIPFKIPSKQSLHVAYAWNKAE